ncbi:MAG: SH3 domain-containing protein [Verrucomicrobiae bacterium]|nr:SH3 domain-containing protein [Verrucomicrobiae bacterium]
MLSQTSKADNGDSFSAANRDFAAGQHKEAVQKYQETLKTMGPSAPVLFNLANAQFRSGNLGEAVLQYERALWLSPHDPDIAANLQVVRKAAGLYDPEFPWWQHYFRLFSLDAWSLLASLSFAILCVLGSLRLLLRQTPAGAWTTQTPWKTAAGLTGLALLLSLTGIFTLCADLDRAIILAPDTPCRIAPYDNAQTTATLNAGETVEVQREHEGFLQIRNLQGKTGWIAKKQIALIVP